MTNFQPAVSQLERTTRSKDNAFSYLFRIFSKENIHIGLRYSRFKILITKYLNFKGETFLKFPPGRNVLNPSKYTGTYQNCIILKQKCISDFVVLASSTNHWLFDIAYQDLLHAFWILCLAHNASKRAHVILSLKWI